MAEPSKETPFQTVYRLTVVAGVLACGSMAALHYGPEAGELAEAIDTAATMVGAPVPAPEPMASAEFDSDGVTIDAASASPAPRRDDPAQQLDDPAPRFDDQVLPASGLVTEPTPVTPEELTAPQELDRLERERLTAPLLAAGAERADVHPWGDSGNRMYRATASAPVGAPNARLLREFDAIAATPEAAVSAVRSQLRTTAIR